MPCSGSRLRSILNQPGPERARAQGPRPLNPSSAHMGDGVDVLCEQQAAAFEPADPEPRGKRGGWDPGCPLLALELPRAQGQPSVPGSVS